MKKDQTINIAVYESAPDEVELIATELRNAGHVVKPFAFKTPDHLKKILAKNRIECVYCSADESVLTPTCQILDNHQYHIPIIAVATDTDTASVVKALEKGARDLVSRNQSAHLRLVTERELKNMYHYRSMHKYQGAYEESEKRCHSLLDSSREAIAYIHDGMHTYSNGVYAKVFGFDSSEELEGLPILDLITVEDQQQFKELLVEYDTKTDSQEYDISCRRNDDTEFSASIELAPANIDGEACTQIIVRDHASSVTMINELKTFESQDTVTGLYNRQTFIEEVEQAIVDVRTGSSPGVVFYIDIDKFSKVQGAIGMEKMDAVISTVGRIIADALAPNDFGARFGEHVFTILTKEKHIKAIRSRARKLVKSLNTVIEVGELSTPITVSLGLASIHSTTRSAYEVLTYADLACNTAKESGGNRAEAYKDIEKKAKKQAIQDNLRWINLLKNAMENNIFYLAFQPVVSLTSTGDEIYKVLLRLNSEDGKKIDNSEFLLKAERVGMINLVDRWVIRRTLHILGSKEYRDSKVSLLIKLSSSAYSDKNLLPWLFERVKSAKIKPSRLIFEITESGAAQYIKKTANFSRTLRMMKCRTAITQFGMDNNAPKLLKVVPADFIKVNPALTCDISNDPIAMQKVKELVQTAHTMDKPIIASHVENAESMAAVFQCGFDFVQGHFLQKPDTVMRFDFEHN